MLVLWGSTQQSINPLATAPQVQGRGDHGTGGGGGVRWGGGRNIRPIRRDVGPAPVRQHQHQVKPAPAPDLAENLQHHAIEGMVLADNPDLTGKAVEVGSVSGGSSIAFHRTACSPL